MLLKNAVRYGDGSLNDVVDDWKLDVEKWKDGR